MDPPITTHEGRIAVKLVLDTDAAAVLPDLAGSSRKQGEYVSKLIRQAAAARHAPPPPDQLVGFRQELLALAGELSALTKQVLDLAGEKPSAP